MIERSPKKNPIRWRALHIPAKLHEIVAALGAENRLSVGEAAAILIHKGILVVGAENEAKRKVEAEAQEEQSPVKAPLAEGSPTA